MGSRTAGSRMASWIDALAPAAKIIRALYDRAVQRVMTPESRCGCLLNNSAVELAATDALAADQIKIGLGIMEEAFFVLVKRGQREGTVGVGHDARALARFLTSGLNGILVMGKADPNPDRLYDVVDVTMSALP